MAGERHDNVHNRIDGTVTGNVVQVGAVHGPAYFGPHTESENLLVPPFTDLPPDPPEAWLLQPRFRVVPYLGRADLLADLRTWCTEARLFSIGLLTGDGGAGKSRTAAELCIRLVADGWDAGFAPMTEAQYDRVVERPTLLVFDYPDQRVDVLGTFLERVACRSRGPYVRALLLARHRTVRSHWWAALDSASKRTASQFLRFERDLTAHALTDTERAAHAEAAVQAFARQLDLHTDLPRVDAVDLDTPLLIHMAALLAVRGENVEQRVRGNVGQNVLAQMLVREQRRWARLQSAHRLDDLHIVHAARAVLLAVLTRPTTAEIGDLLTTLAELSAPEQCERRDRIRHWLSELYPGEPVAATFGPDRLTEEFLAVAADRLDLASLVTALYAHPACTTRHLSHLMDSLRLASERRSGPAVVLRDLLTNELPALAIRALEAPDNQLLAAVDNALARFGKINDDTIHLPFAAAKSVLALPLHSVRGAHLLCTIARLGLPLFRRLAEVDPDSHAELALMLHLYASRCDEAGLFEDSLSAAEECVEIRRRIAADDPTRGRSELVLDLANLAGTYREFGYDKALITAEEAVVLGRPLADGSIDGRYRLAAAVQCLSGIQFELQQFEQATATNSEAVAIIRGLAEEDSAYDGMLADALTVRCGLLQANGLHRESLAAIAEAINCRVRLAEQEPNRYLPRLVHDLHNLALIQNSDMGDPGEARITAELAVELAKTLVTDNPARYRSSLIHALDQLSVVLIHQGETEAAAQAAGEAVKLGRYLAGTPRGDRILAGSLLHFADATQYTDRREDTAITAAQEAVALWRGLAEFTGYPLSTELAATLRHLAQMYTRMRRWDDGLRAAEEAVHLYRQIADISPGHLPDLAIALTKLAEARVATDEEALSVAEEAVHCYRQLDDKRMAGLERDFCLSLASLSDRYVQADRRPEALATILEAVRLAEGQPAFDFQFALILAKLADRYAALRNLANALGAVSRSVEIYERITGAKPHRIDDDFAFALRILGRIRQNLGDHAAAVPSFELAVGKLDRLAAAQPATYQARFAEALVSLRQAYADVGRFTDALHIGRRATDIYQDLAEQAPSQYLAELADSLDRLSYLYAMCGDLTAASATSHRYRVITEQLGFP